MEELGAFLSSFGKGKASGDISCQEIAKAKRIA